MPQIGTKGFVFGSGARAIGTILVIGCAAALSRATAAELSPTGETNSPSEPTPGLESGQKGLWDAGVGEGFRPGVESFNVGLGGAYGLAAFGGHQSHDLALLNLEYGHMLGHTMAEGHWFRGNLEFRLQLFSGAEFSPSQEWLVGLTPHLRYDFATGTSWIPFFDLGAGVTATGIGPPDLSNIFEFNLQAGVGVHWFVRDNMALTLEGRYLHMSCAGLSSPNAGLNAVVGLLGVSWFF